MLIYAISSDRIIVDSLRLLVNLVQGKRGKNQRHHLLVDAQLQMRMQIVGKLVVLHRKLTIR